MKSGKSWEKVTGKIQVYLSNKPTPVVLHYGDEILVKGQPVKLSPPANPGEFDFQRFLSFRNTSHQQFITSDQIRIVSQTDRRGILFYAQNARAWATSQIRKFVPGVQEQAITLALVLGVVEGLGNDLQDAYAASGAMHVLSVSGLHVGVIYAIILLLLKPFSGLSWSRWLVAFLSLICLWAYALVTGLSPSVLRAVMMFSFIVVARPFGRNTNIYNTLAASAFLLLIYDPFLIMSVGFQLSYLAVLGIVYLQRPLYNAWEPTSLVWDKIWQVTCVSLAAQVATFVLGLFYFHQFPVYFLFSNLLVVPLSTAVLVAGIVLLAVCPFVWLASGIGHGVQFLVKLLNGSVFLIERLPFSVIEGVQISAGQCWLLLGATVSIILLFKERRFKFILLALAFATLFLFLQWQHFFRDVDREQMIVYCVPGHGSVEWVDRGHSYFYSDSVLVHDERRVRFHLRPYRLLCGVSLVHTNSPAVIFLKSYPGFHIFLWKKNRVLWIDQPNSDLPDNMEADYLILGNNSVRSLESLQRKVKFRQLILDSSNSSRYTTRISQEARMANISVYSVLEQGAFIVTL